MRDKGAYNMTLGQVALMLIPGKSLSIGIGGD
jgi:hypothetical protein